MATKKEKLLRVELDIILHISGMIKLKMVIEEKDLHLRLVFSPCLCAYLRPLESPQQEEMATRTVDTDTVVLSRLPIWWILHISSSCAELVTFSAREERTDLLPV